MTENPHRVRVILECRHAHRHETVTRGPPPELRCDPHQGQGYGSGDGGGCTVPPDLSDRVERELRDALQESKRRGYVVVAA